MDNIQTFKDLEVWQEGHKMVLLVYSAAAGFPREEEFILKAQLIRAATSVPTNIAEGKGRNTTKEFLRFLDISNGSLEETKYLTLLAYDLKYIDQKKILNS